MTSSPAAADEDSANALEVEMDVDVERRPVSVSTALDEPTKVVGIGSTAVKDVLVPTRVLSTLTLEAANGSVVTALSALVVVEDRAEVENGSASALDEAPSAVTETVTVLSATVTVTVASAPVAPAAKADVVKAVAVPKMSEEEVERDASAESVAEVEKKMDSEVMPMDVSAGSAVLVGVSAIEVVVGSASSSELLMSATSRARRHNVPSFNDEGQHGLQHRGA